MSITLIPKLLAHKRLAVFSHIRPDGDALGSQIGMVHWLKQHGVDAVAFNQDQPSPSIAWLTKLLEIVKPKEEDLDGFDGFVYMDGNRPDRFGKIAEKAAELGKPLYLVDHHPEPLQIYTDQHWDVKASSTAELVYRLFKATSLDQIPRDAAIALYTGMVTDTGSFRFDSVSPATHRAAADLLQLGGFKPNIVHERLYDQRTSNQYALLGLALSGMQFFAGGRIGTIHVTSKMFQDTDTSYEDTDAFVSYPMSVVGVEVAVIFVEHEGRVKLSFRSKTDLDVNQWARQFEGGGHAKAAGGWTNGPLEEAIHRVLEVGIRALEGS
jgi:bifunctional oligoribonuclease and PAP phosphatase NrnA